MEKTIIQQIEGRFLSKKNYEFQLRISIDKAFGEYASAINSLNNILSIDKIKVLKVLIGIAEFQNKIDKQIIELKSHYNSRLDIVVSAENKAEYIYLENEKINELIASIHRIIISYGIKKLTNKANVLSSEKNKDLQLPFDNDISNGILSSLLSFAENFVNNTDAISNAIFNSPIFDKSIDEILVENMVVSIKKINTVSLHIIKNNHNVFDDTYLIIGNDFITKLTKVSPKVKTETTLPKSELENHSLTEVPIYETNQSVEPLNEHPKIFKNGYAFELFLKLKEMSVKPSTQLADFAFIFHSMKRLKYIFDDVKHKTFIDMLVKDFNADISAIKFSYKNQDSKKVMFSSLLKEFKPLIDSVP